MWFGKLLSQLDTKFRASVTNVAPIHEIRKVYGLYKLSLYGIRT